jgi:hypothetical protein
VREGGLDVPVSKCGAPSRQFVTLTPTIVQRIAHGQLFHAIDGFPVGSLCQELERVCIQRGWKDRGNAGHLSKQCDALERSAAGLAGGSVDRLQWQRLNEPPKGLAGLIGLAG